MTEIILRSYPNYINENSYPLRYSKEILLKYKKLYNDSEFLKNYNLLLSGINFKTNRKINIKGKKFFELKNEMINKYNFEENIFKKIENINIDEYLIQTDNIIKKINEKNIPIKKYNLEVKEIIKKIDNLNNWNDYIIFENKKYGIKNIINNKHMENNCFGNIIFDYSVSCSCSSCENWFGCGEKSKNYYKCDKCDFKYQK